MTSLRFLLGLAVLLFLITAGLMNMEPQVTLRYFFGYESAPMPFFFALLAAIGIGVLFTLFFAVIEQLRLHAVIRRQRRQIAEMERDIAEFKQLLPEHLIQQSLRKPAASAENSAAGNNEK